VSSVGVGLRRHPTLQQYEKTGAFLCGKTKGQQSNEQFRIHFRSRHLYLCGSSGGANPITPWKRMKSGQQYWSSQDRQRISGRHF
jgi:hypothetical protein